MKVVFTLIPLFFLFTTNVDATIPDSIPAKASGVIVKSPGEKNAPFRTTCAATLTTAGDEPLIIIDGLPVEFNELRKLSPNDICAIYILKDAAASAIYGSRAAKGVVLITTKSASARKIIVRDFLNGNNIPFATIRLGFKNDEVVLAADDKGMLVTDKLKPGAEYEMTVSSAGYKSFTTTMRGRNQEVLLERDIKENDNVTVFAYSYTRRRDCCVCGLCSTFKSAKTDLLESGIHGVVKNLYPNPVQRNNVFNLELENAQGEAMQLIVMGLDGRMVLQQSEKINKGLNHISVAAEAKWAAGTYIVQLRNTKGTVIKQEKLMVQ